MKLSLSGSVIALALATSFVGAACTEEPQEFVLAIDTDALVPDPANTDPIAPEPMFDRVEFSLFQKNEAEPCSNCTRTFAVDAGLLRRRSLSIGISTSMLGARVRIRLFRSGNSGVPRPASTLEVVGRIPETVEHPRLRVFLSTDTLGSPRGSLDAPVPIDADNDAPSLVGTFGAGSFASCDDPPPDGTACIPGRYMWAAHVEDPGFEKLTRLSTFRVDPHEWSATRFRAAGGRIDTLGSTSSTYSPTAKCPETDGDYPAGCLTGAEAERLCRKADGRLPSFQEFQLLAGGLRGFLFPWGNDPPTCADAVIGRIEVRLPQSGWTKELCSTKELGGYPSGPANVGEPFGKDVLDVGGVSILGLEGNVTEYAHSSLFGKCESDAFIATDPRCDDYVTYTGGSYGDPVPAGSMTLITRSVEAGGDPRLGFRCVYDVK